MILLIKTIILGSKDSKEINTDGSDLQTNARLAEEENKNNSNNAIFDKEKASHQKYDYFYNRRKHLSKLYDIIKNENTLMSEAQRPSSMIRALSDETTDISVIGMEIFPEKVPISATRVTETSVTFPASTLTKRPSDTLPTSTVTKKPPDTLQTSTGETRTPTVFPVSTGDIKSSAGFPASAVTTKPSAMFPASTGTAKPSAEFPTSAVTTKPSVKIPASASDTDVYSETAPSLTAETSRPQTTVTESPYITANTSVSDTISSEETTEPTEAIPTPIKEPEYLEWDEEIWIDVHYCKYCGKSDYDLGYVSFDSQKGEFLGLRDWSGFTDHCYDCPPEDEWGLAGYRSGKQLINVIHHRD